MYKKSTNNNEHGKNNTELFGFVTDDTPESFNKNDFMYLPNVYMHGENSI